MENVSGSHQQIVSRRTVLAVGASIGAMAAAGRGSDAVAAGGCDLVGSGGRVRAQLVVAAEAPGVIAEAVEEFVDYVERMTGVRLPVAASEPPTQLNAIYIGEPGTRTARAGVPAPTEVTDGYSVASGPRAVTVLGGGPYGVINGLCALLRTLGVEWLLPGDLGEVVPAVSSLSVPYGTFSSDPVFAQRMMSPLHGLPGTGAQALGNTWAARNALQGWHNAPLAFHHNLWTLFPVEEFGATHPEYYANGKVPASGVTIGWQPAFSNSATVDVAVAKINSWFDDHPESASFSLGVNDSAGYEVGVDPVGSYYRWVNAVVTRVVATHPGKRFGLLAYHDVEPVPEFDLHPAVVPFFTEDRLAWVDPIQRQESQDLLTRWRERAASLALYDYVYGWPYLVPRMHQALVADALQFAAGLQTVGFYAELYPNWGEGPKPWILARLAWDPSADVDELAEQWCRLAVGPAAAADLRAYFAVWEVFWTSRIIESPWLRPGATYQDFTSPGYLAEVDDQDVARCRTLIDSVLAKAGTPVEKERALLMARVWEFAEASILSYPREVAAAEDAGAAMAVLDRAVATVERRTTLAQRRLDLLAEFREDPLLRPSFDPSRYSKLIWTGWNASEFWAVVVFIKRHEPAGGPVTERARELAGSADTAGGRAWAEAVVRAVEAPQLLQNPSFEDVDPNDTQLPEHWVVLPRHTGTRSIVRDVAVSVDGAASCLSRGTGWGGPTQVIPALPGLVRLAFQCRAASSATATSVQIAIDLCDANGVRIGSGTVRSAVIALSRDDQWHELTLTGEIPATVSGRPVETLVITPLYDSVGETRVWTDRMELYLAPQESS